MLPGRETSRLLIRQPFANVATLSGATFSTPKRCTVAQTMGTIEHLKMLTLLTYADTKAVNPEALTEGGNACGNSHAAAENYLNRSLRPALVRCPAKMPNNGAFFDRSGRR